MKRTLIVGALCLMHFALSPMAQAAPPRDPSRLPEYVAMEKAMMAERMRMDSLEALESPRVAGPRRLPAIGTRSIFPRVPVIMVNFSNRSFKSETTHAYVDSLFNGQHWTGNGAYGSVRQYFRDQSMNAYDPQFDVYGPVTVSQRYQYYGANSGTNNGVKVPELVIEACNLVNDSVDFTQYDSDSDGRLDIVFIYFAGYGENDSTYIVANGLMTKTEADSLIWPNYSSTNLRTNNNNNLDGKRVYAYECANELDGLFSKPSKEVQAGIGVLCHEFGHGMGLPDLYSSAGININGLWSLMDYGCYGGDGYVPVNMTAYERYFMGWLTPEMLTVSGNKSLGVLHSSNQAYMITRTGLAPSTAKSDSLYILENRKGEGWDASLADYSMEGLLVWRILPWSGSPVNVGQGNAANKIDLIRADGDATSKYASWGKMGDAYPYGSVDSVKIKEWGVALRNITRSGDAIEFDFDDGTPVTPTAEASVASKQTPSKQLLNGQLIIIRDEEEYTVLGTRIR